MCQSRINQEIITNELSEYIDEFEIEGFEFTTAQDLLIIGMYCNSVIENLPGYYTISTNFTEDFPIMYMVLGVENENFPMFTAKYYSILKAEF